MNNLQELLINIMFFAGIVFIAAYVLLWIFSPGMRREIEQPKYRMLERDREIWREEEEKEDEP